MSRDIAIRVERVGKRYRLGERQSYKALRDSLAEAARSANHALAAPFRRSIARSTPAENSTWALRDLSFEVRRGEVLGIIGRNGAGKSTLLKILSRITEPTEGVVDVCGRVGSLLEVGTGFHPELTGRENVYLNGAILGMKRVEIDRKFDEIVAFAEIEKFLDTPVKRYSSGMYMRLAFAVATHLETDILAVDEVLAVGDAQFQKKCFQKMQEIGRGGRTILFVSHNMSAVRHICNRGLVLEHGKPSYLGPINHAVDRYLALGQPEMAPAMVETPSFLVEQLRVTSKVGLVPKTFEPLEVLVTFTPKRDIRDPGLYIGILTLDNQRLAGLDFKDFATVPPLKAGQATTMGFALDSLPLLPGEYLIEVHLKDMAALRVELVPHAFGFSVAEAPVYGGRKLDSWFGLVGLKARPLAYAPASGNGEASPL